jgi:Ca2+-binding EF-hand superfamily protein
MNAQSLLLFILSAAILPLVTYAKPDGAQRDVGNPRQPPSIEQVFARLDADASGGISVDEAEGPLEGHFDQIDADGNGEITGAELKASRAKRFERGIEMRERIKAADGDGNGAISNNEANEAGLDKLIEHFDKIDSDGDGEITKQELKNLNKKRR